MRLMSYRRGEARGWGAVIDGGVVDLSKRSKHADLKSALAAGDIVGPIAGGLLAVGIAYILRGRGTGIQAAQGRLEEIVAENTEQPRGSSETR